MQGLSTAQNYHQKLEDWGPVYPQADDLFYFIIFYPHSRMFFIALRERGREREREREKEREKH